MSKHVKVFEKIFEKEQSDSECEAVGLKPNRGRPSSTSCRRLVLLHSGKATQSDKAANEKQ